MRYSPRPTRALLRSPARSRTVRSQRKRWRGWSGKCSCPTAGLPRRWMPTPAVGRARTTRGPRRRSRKRSARNWPGSPAISTAYQRRAASTARTYSTRRFRSNTSSTPITLASKSSGPSLRKSAPSCSRPAASARPCAVTTRCWLTGTALRSPPLPGTRVPSVTAATLTWPARLPISSLPEWSAGTKLCTS